MKKCILIDMDEVIALYTYKVIETLNRETGINVDLIPLGGKFLSQSLEPELVELVSSYPYRKGFFRDLKVMPDSQRVLRRLIDQYEVMIVSACLQHPNSLNDKLFWLQENFPFISYQKIVFCGEKKQLYADYMVDDHPRHLESFRGFPLLFSAFHNSGEKRFRRFENWLQLEEFFMNPPPAS